MDSLVKELKQYKNTILEKINQNQYKKNYSSQRNDDSLILNPLADKERAKMGNNEKEQF